MLTTSHLIELSIKDTANKAMSIITHFKYGEFTLAGEEMLHTDIIDTISQKLNVKIWVSPRRMALLKSSKKKKYVLENYSENKDECRIFCQDFSTFDEAMLLKNARNILIYFTESILDDTKENIARIETLAKNKVFVIPFSQRNDLKYLKKLFHVRNWTLGNIAVQKRFVELKYNTPDRNGRVSIVPVARNEMDTSLAWSRKFGDHQYAANPFDSSDLVQDKKTKNRNVRQLRVCLQNLLDLKPAKKCVDDTLSDKPLKVYFVNNDDKNLNVHYESFKSAEDMPFKMVQSGSRMLLVRKNRLPSEATVSRLEHLTAYKVRKITFKGRTYLNQSKEASKKTDQNLSEMQYETFLSNEPLKTMANVEPIPEAPGNENSRLGNILFSHPENRSEKTRPILLRRNCLAKPRKPLKPNPPLSNIEQKPSNDKSKERIIIDKSLLDWRKPDTDRLGVENKMRLFSEITENCKVVLDKSSTLEKCELSSEENSIQYTNIDHNYSLKGKADCEVVEEKAIRPVRQCAKKSQELLSVLYRKRAYEKKKKRKSRPSVVDATELKSDMQENSVEISEVLPNNESILNSSNSATKSLMKTAKSGVCSGLNKKSVKSKRKNSKLHQKELKLVLSDVLKMTEFLRNFNLIPNWAKKQVPVKVKDMRLCKSKTINYKV